MMFWCCADEIGVESKTEWESTNEAIPAGGGQVRAGPPLPLRREKSVQRVASQRLRHGGVFADGTSE